jgi:hypothetical protein
MPLTPYTATETPPQEKVLALKPRLLAWTSRVWRESPGRAVPLFKIDVRIEPRDIDDKELAQALRPFAAQLDKVAIYLLHPEETPRLAPWAVGTFDVDRKAGFMFFHDFLSASNANLMMNLMQTAGAATDLVMSIVPFRVEAEKIVFAVTGYDLGIHNRIG